MRRKVQLELMGGIGNQMFIYAAGKWLSRKFGLAVSFDARLLSLEKVHGGLITDMNITGSVATLNGKWTIGRIVASVERVLRNVITNFGKKSKYGVFRPKVYVGGHDFEASSIEESRYKYVSAFFQSYRYGSEVLDELQDEYQLKSESNWLVEKRDLAKKSSILAIHVRQGDYLSLRDSFGLLSADYYGNAIETLRNENFMWDEIWVFSDDVVRAKDMISDVLAKEKVSYIVPPEGTNPIESLMLFSEATLGIIANSTFSWWACFLSRNMKVVLAPTVWFRSVTYPQDLIPDSWLRIPSLWQE